MEEVQRLLFGGAEPVASSITLYRSLDFADLHVISVSHDLSPEILRKRPISPNYQGLCSIHRETRPSFVVRPSENRFCCYGCGKHGGAFQLLAILTINPLDYLSRQFNFEFTRDCSRLAEVLDKESFLGRFESNKYASRFGL